MKKRLILCLAVLLGMVSCSRQVTGDMQYFELKGKVSSLGGVPIFPDEKVSFDNLGIIDLPGEVSSEEEMPMVPAEYTGPFKVINWNPEAEDGEVYDYFEPLGVTLAYDSTGRLVMVAAGMSAEILSYDKHGRLCSILTEDEGMIEVSEITYDKDGNRVQEYIFDPEALGNVENGWYIEYDQYQFDKQGNWVSRRVRHLDYYKEVTYEYQESREGRITYCQSGR